MHETIYAQLDRETIYLSAPGLAMHRVGKKLYLYCEYHDVLDVHERKEMETFLRGLDDVEHMSKILLSHGSSGDSERTLDELIEAGVVHLFDRIVFTKNGTSGSHARSCTTKKHTAKQAYIGKRKRRHPRSREIFQEQVVITEIPYDVFDGGKVAFIHRTHPKEEDAAILIVDNKADILCAICDETAWNETPLPHVIEMRQNKPFHTKEGETFRHARSLTEVLNIVIRWSVNASVEKTSRRAEERSLERKRKSAEMETPSDRMTSLRDFLADNLHYLLRLDLSADNIPSLNEITRAFIEKRARAEDEESKERLREALVYLMQARSSLGVCDQESIASLLK